MPKPKTETIKCCPFCGSHKVEIARTNPHACWVICAPDDGGCGAQTPSHATRKRAIDNWNRRYYDDTAARIVSDDDKRIF